MKANETLKLLPPRAEMERAFARKDSAYDGVFFTAVRTTGIFCRPSCPSRPHAENLEFFQSVNECVFAGYRPCKRCRPLEAGGTPPAWVSDLMAKVESSPEACLQAADLLALGITPERARRWFKEHYGMSFTAWCRGRRLAAAFTQIRDGAPIDEVTFGSGFGSHSGFREAFTRTFAEPPGRTRRIGARIVTVMLESPLGPILAGASEEGICLVEFTDRRMLEHNFATMRRIFGCPVVPGEHPLLNQLRVELAEYFAGKRRSFGVPLASRGTSFQEKVWGSLGRIPFGETISYDELARRIDQPTARRAVARANGMNRICILIPCHRVIGKDGTLTGYGGGLWRKRLLLELEKSGTLPGTGPEAPCS